EDTGETPVVQTVAALPLTIRVHLCPICGNRLVILGFIIASSRRAVANRGVPSYDSPTPMQNEIVADIHDLWKIYRKPGTDVEVPALRGVSVTIRRGEYLAIMGASGSGKST